MGQTRQRGVLRWGPKNAFAGQSARCQTVPAPVQHKEKGQALIELALVLPIILVFLMVIIDFGLALDHREVLQHAVREGARRAAVEVDCKNIEDYVLAQSQGTLKDRGDIAVTYGDENGNTNSDAGESVEVSATYTYEFTIGGGELLGVWNVPIPTIDMTPSAQARLEKTVPGASGC